MIWFPTPAGEGFTFAAVGLQALIVAPLKVAPIGQVRVRPEIFGPSLLIKASVLPERDARRGVICGCPEDDAAGKFPEFVSPPT